MYTRVIRTGTFIGNYVGINGGDGESVGKRLDVLIAANAELAREKELALAEAMRHPIRLQKALALFGLMLGTVPLLLISAPLLFEAASESFVILFAGLYIAAGVTTGATGHYSAKFTARAISRIDRYSFPTRIFLLALIGLSWGGASGAVGGLCIFIVGSIFGAVIGAAIGAVALPLFVFLFRAASNGGFIERRHFLPIAFGITLSICGFILGL